MSESIDDQLRELGVEVITIPASAEAAEGAGNIDSILRPLCLELVLMIENNKEEDTEIRSVFLPRDSTNGKIAFAKGQKLWTIGQEDPSIVGFVAMHLAYTKVKDAAGGLGPADMRQLECCWDGIGTWQW